MLAVLGDRLPKVTRCQNDFSANYIIGGISINVVFAFHNVVSNTSFLIPHFDPPNILARAVTLHHAMMIADGSPWCSRNIYD